MLWLNSLPIKNISSYTIFIFSVLISLIFSCDIEPYEGGIPDNSNPGTNNNEPGVFKVDVDGQTYIADNAVATVLDNVVNISGFKTSTGEVIILTIFGNSAGTYQLGVTQNQVEVNAATYSGNGGTWPSVTDFVTSQGEITITEIDRVNNTITGTFFFTGNNPTLAAKEFTNGSFTKVPYEDSLGGNNGNNTFFTKVDGVEFVEDAIGGALLSLSGVPPTIMITATKNNIKTISISVTADIVMGDYTFSTFDPPMGQYNLSLTEGTVSDDGGNLTITEHDVVNKRLVGTFNFTASPLITTGPSYEITEGSFDVTYL